MVSEKFCFRCKTTKPVVEFSKSIKKRDGLQTFCKTCSVKASLASYKKHQKAYDDKSKEWLANNLDRKRAIYRKYHDKNVEERNAHCRQWQRLNRDRALATQARRRAAKMMAVPKWSDRSAILDVYAESAYTGLSVDHIVPLRSPIVCGLHVWDNLQLLPMRENVSKGNRRWPDMP